MKREPWQYTSIVELLFERAAQHPERRALAFLGDGDNVTQAFTYVELHDRARALAVQLAERAAPGDRAVLLYPSGPAYVVAFLGCLYAGVIAVPAYPPASREPQHWGRLASILEDAGPRLVLTDEASMQPLAAVQASLPKLAGVQVLATDAVDTTLAERFGAQRPRPDGVALLQYTSGSTALPKGVMVTHENLMAGERAIQSAFSMAEDDVVISWLPLFHDMGLIGTLLQPLYRGISGVLMSPQHFMERPERWLQAVCRHGGTVSGGPDFAYRLCAQRIDVRAQEGLNLGSWRLAFCGAEPIRHATLRAFADKLAPLGFDPRALYPCYGLAESTLLVTGGRRGAGARAVSFDAHALREDRVLASEAGVPLVSCGRVQPEHELVVADPQSGEPLGEDTVGEIRVTGASVSPGYWNNPAATSETFVPTKRGGLLRTGDLGFLHQGELFVTGRQKDLIIVRGHNLYPQDIERSIEDATEVVRKGRTVAFAVELAGEECIAVAAEVSPRIQRLIDADAVCRAISEGVAKLHGEPARLVLLLNPGGVPITSSGKLMRAACRKAWQKKQLDAFASFELPPRASA